jgi:hypothetical protein
MRRWRLSFAKFRCTEWRQSNMFDGLLAFKSVHTGLSLGEAPALERLASCLGKASRIRHLEE